MNTILLFTSLLVFIIFIYLINGNSIFNSESISAFINIQWTILSITLTGTIFLFNSKKEVKNIVKDNNPKRKTNKEKEDFNTIRNNENITPLSFRISNILIGILLVSSLLFLAFATLLVYISNVSSFLNISKVLSTISFVLIIFLIISIITKVTNKIVNSDKK